MWVIAVLGDLHDLTGREDTRLPLLLRRLIDRKLRREAGGS
jgi:hypothetical protein